METTHELIIAIMNRGYSDDAMNAARTAGATGGTITHGRGTGGKEAQKFLGVAIHPEKELILILVTKELRNQIMKAITQAVGLETAGQGICFSLPVEAVTGLTPIIVKEKSALYDDGTALAALTPESQPIDELQPTSNTASESTVAEQSETAASKSTVAEQSKTTAEN